MTAAYTTHGVSLLDDVEELILEGEVTTALDQLRTGLNRLRSSLSPDEWRNFVQGEVQSRSCLANLDKSEPAIRRWELSLPAIQALHIRGKVFAQEVEEVCNAIRHPKILSVGSEHLQEADGNYHFIYAAHLYDRLDCATARRLTTRLVAKLKPGGRLMIANISPSAADAGYLEACRNWWPTYRDEEAMVRLAADVDKRLLGHIAFTDDLRQTTYLDLAVK